MIEPNLQSRIVRGFTMAAFDYSAAAHQAAFEAARQILGFWSAAIGGSEPEPERRSWYRHPDEPQSGRTTLRSSPVPEFLFAAFGANPFAAATGATGPFTGNPVGAWQAMLTAPWTLTPAAWPMAYMMVAGGIPKSVAWPAAEANVAAADAAIAMGEAVDQAYSRYRSDGGHAVAQIIMLPLKASVVALAALPLATSGSPFAAVPFANMMSAMPWQMVFSPAR